jgi:HSP20 family protein
MTLVKVNQHPVHKGFNNFFDEILNEFPAFGAREWTRNGFGSVPVNIHETADAYHLELNAPGRNKEDFKLNVENGLLTISFEKKEENKTEDYKTVRKEFVYQSFKRSFNLDDNIDANNIQAKYENGLLKLFLPKKEQVKENAKQINID